MSKVNIVTSKARNNEILIILNNNYVVTLILSSKIWIQLLLQYLPICVREYVQNKLLFNKLFYHGQRNSLNHKLRHKY